MKFIYWLKISLQKNPIIHRVTKGSPNRNEQLIMISNLNQKLEEYKKKVNLRVEYLKNSIK